MVSSFRGIHASGISAHTKREEDPQGPRHCTICATLVEHWPGTDWSRPLFLGIRLIPNLAGTNLGSGRGQTDPKNF
jgi:hypothetical protein